MSDVFLAYAPADLSKALLLAKALERRQWTVTWRDTHPDDWEPGDHHSLVVLWSRDGLGMAGLRFAAEEASRRRKLTQALVGDVRPPRGLRHGVIADLIDWEGSDGDPGLGDLVAELTRTIAAAPEMEAKYGDADTTAEPEPEPPPSAAITAAQALVAGRRQRLAGHDGEVYDLDISRKGDLLASASADRTARLWDLRKGRTAAVLAGHDDEVNDIAISPDGQKLATASDDGTVGLWKADGSLLRRLDHHDGDAVFTVDMAPKGGLGASGDEEGFVAVWRADDGSDVWMLEHDEGVSAVRFLPDGTVLATGADNGAVTLWDMESGEPLARIDAHDTGIADLAVSPDATLLATSSEHAELGLWNLDGSLHWWSDDIAGSVYGLAFSADGALLAASDDEGIVLWAAVAGEPIARLEDPDATRIEFGADGRTIAWTSGTEVRVLAT